MSKNENKVDWSKAPKDAVAHAIDSNGAAFFYTEIPKMGQVTWETGADYKSDYGIYPEWRDSLQIRPLLAWQPKRFEAVLVRNFDNDPWHPRVFFDIVRGLYNTNLPNYGSAWLQCIPLEGNEHLTGTTKNPEQ